MKFLLIRGGYLNRYEGQNFEHLSNKVEITAIASKYPIHVDFNFPVKKFFSLHDLSQAPLIPATINSTISKGVKWVGNRLFGDTQFLYGLEEYVRESGPYDVAWIADTHYGYALQAVNLKKQGYIKKIISTCWEIIPHNNEKTIKKRYIKDQVRGHTDLFICPTKLAKQALVVEGVAANKIRIIPVGIDITKFKPKKVKKRSKYLDLLFVGRLVKEKGLFDLISIYEAVKKNNKNIRLKIVGDGPLLPYLQNKLRPGNFRDVSMMTSAPYEKMSHLYQDSDLMLILSQSRKDWKEQYCMSAVEAMASGCAIVYYQSGALVEVIGNSGIGVAEGDKTWAQRSISQLYHDEKARLRYSKTARERAKKYYDSRKCAAQYLRYSKI